MEQNRREVGTERDQASQPPQAERKHPPEYEQDLNPDRLAGQNIGIPRDQMPNAFEMKSVNRSLQDFSDDELRSIPIVPQGERLQQGATYLDLSDRSRGEFTATGEMSAGSSDCIVPKDEVPYTLWNRLRGISDPERTT